MKVSMSELRSHLSSILARAREGEVIVVTSYNKPIARIVGIPELPNHELAKLVAEGLVSWNGGKPEFPLKRWRRSGAAT